MKNKILEELKMRNIVILIGGDEKAPELLGGSVHINYEALNDYLFEEIRNQNYKLTCYLTNSIVNLYTYGLKECENLKRGDNVATIDKIYTLLTSADLLLHSRCSDDWSYTLSEAMGELYYLYTNTIFNKLWGNRGQK